MFGRISGELRRIAACSAVFGAWLLGAPALAAAPVKITVTQPSAAASRPSSKPVIATSAAEVKISAPQIEQVHVTNVDASRAKPRVAITAESATLSVQPGQQLVVRRDEAAAAPVVELSAATKAPLESTLLVGTRDADSRPNVRRFHPFVLAQVSPLRWNAQALAYQTTLLVGLDPVEGDSQADLTLEPPIPFQVTGENLEQIAPSLVTISVAGPGGYRSVLLSTSQFDSRIKVSAHSTAGDGTFSAGVEPGPVRFSLGSSERSIEGLGLGQTTISVRRLAANGELWPGLQSPTVDMTTSAGLLRPGQVQLAEKTGDGRTSLVSRGWGSTTVSAVGSAGTVTVDFTFPWLKLGLCVAAAALAGVLQVLRSAKRAWLTGLLGSVLSGLTLPIFIALGAPFAPEWLRGAIGSELAWLAVGVLGGYLGAALLDWLVEKIFGLKSGARPEPEPQH